ncbi:hypothetical protein C9374_011342 [Naegleria lovaniensis]|uniref:Uncharacterized protein n=1 Tax=Naegleria lovaniensis TaxID=51637 RepID=A0AA88KQS5_NAELO|nr:uncharacterized protein C9374_011342 [Naegleria lovaniensis]KAG2392617.1 hypothetical protein C9374_011342 [Naegleria lovaniensis]
MRENVIFSAHHHPLCLSSESSDCMNYYACTKNNTNNNRTYNSSSYDVGEYKSSNDTFNNYFMNTLLVLKKKLHHHTTTFIHHSKIFHHFITSIMMILFIHGNMIHAATTEKPKPELEPSILTSLASISGYLATFCFTVQYLPQAYLNHKRKSVKGFSTTGILLKLVGASYLGVNSFLMGEALSVGLYGTLNILQHSVFMIQFTMFTGRKIFLLCLFIPLLPIITGYMYPNSIPYTNLIKPVSQIVSHIPQIIVTWEDRSTEGVSLISQHLNLLGGICGVFMYSVFTPKSFFTRLVYWNSLLQALSIYFLAVYFDGWGRLRNSFVTLFEKSPDPTNSPPNTEEQQEIEKAMNQASSTGVTTSNIITGTSASTSSTLRNTSHQQGALDIEITSITSNIE